jgi:hypothetical protein
MIFRFQRCVQALVRAMPAVCDRCGLLGKPRHNPDRAQEVFVFPRPIPEPRDRAGELCRQYLLLKYGDRAPLAQAFIRDIDRLGAGMDDSQWIAFINARDGADEILKPLDMAFQEWSQT